MWPNRAGQSVSLKKFGTTIILLSVGIVMVSCATTVVQDTSLKTLGEEVISWNNNTAIMGQEKLKLSSTEDFDKVLGRLMKDPRKLVVLLDFDGTLATITPHPKNTFMPVETENTLKSLVNRSDVFVAVISGRGLVDIQEKVKIPGITLAGNHGLEIKYPDGRRYNYTIPEALQNNYTKLYNALKETVAHNNAWVEDKRVSITFHYREAPEAIHDSLRDQAKEIVERFGYKANLAHCAIEAKPPVEWNKGLAAEFIMVATFGKDWQDKVKVVLAGDDTTDEDAMRMMKGENAVSFRVSKDVIKTDADYFLDSPADVGDLLKWLNANCC